MIYDAQFRFGYGRAAAMGMLLFIIVFGATLVNMKAQKTESSF